MMRAVRRIILIAAVVAISGIGLAWAFRFEMAYWRYREPIRAAAARYHVPPHLIAAVIWQETRFHPDRRGPAGEIGLMQIMPGSAGEWAKSEQVRSFVPSMLRNPATNILAGTWYLGRALERWADRADPAPYALAEYNAGHSSAVRWDRTTAPTPHAFIQAIGYPSTRQYVKSILKLADSVGQPWKRLGGE